ncbi:hypothetical protein [Streptococcus sp. NLN76]|uniref:hypothetical protein n=1 Tax=Streptococcus sp. NLN76 TaxID=2822800 RepID=UPI0018AB2BDC|nr:hypothetical protein [Streptococcus sp. NLN76]MBF8969889.1 hypothetical protein [Streptococcus sp. NLN76]
MTFTFSPREFVNSSFLYMIALSVILNTRSIWMHIYGTGNRFSDYVFMLLSLGVLGYFFTKPQVSRKNVHSAIAIAVGVFFYIGFWILVTRYNMLPALKFAASALILVFFFLIQESIERHELLLKYRNVMIIIASLSLIIWMFGSLFHLIQPTGVVQTVWTNTGLPRSVPSYFNLYFETQRISDITRNTAIFTEAPMASLHFSIALLIEAYIQKNFSSMRFGLFSIAILSTFSTTGIVSLILVFLHKYLFTRGRSNLLQVLKIVMLPLILFVAIYVVWWLIETRLGTSSGSVRMDDFIIGIRAWLLNPFFGNGYLNTAFIKQFMGMWRSENTGFSNSITMLLASGGVYMAMLYIVPILSNLKNMKKAMLIPFLLGSIYLFIFTIIPFEYLTIVLIVFLSSYKLDKTAYLM